MAIGVLAPLSPPLPAVNGFRGMVSIPVPAGTLISKREARLRRQLAKAMAMRNAGSTWEDIGARLHRHKDTIRMAIRNAIRRGWIEIATTSTDEDTRDLLLKPKVVRNLNKLLDDEDRAATLMAAKGLGVFQDYSANKNGQAAPQVLQINIAMPTGPTPRLPPGSCGGTPAIIEGLTLEQD